MLVGEVPGNLKHDWPKTWRRYVQRMFDHVDAFVTTSFATKEGFSECVREIGPSFAGNFLIWPEIYCRTLTGPWRPGFPCWQPEIRNSGTWVPRAERCL